MQLLYNIHTCITMIIAVGVAFHLPGEVEVLEKIPVLPVGLYLALRCVNAFQTEIVYFFKIIFLQAWKLWGNTANTQSRIGLS